MTHEPSTLRLYGRHYENGEPIQVTITGSHIIAVDPVCPDGDVGDWPYIAPGLFDLQINGYGGVWFHDDGLTPDDVVTILKQLSPFGITRILPTLITASFDAFAANLSAIREACASDTWVNRMIPGCHLEGPYLSPEDGPRGAHAVEHIRPADWDEFCRLQAISGNRIRLITLAPETVGAIEFIRKAIDAGVIVAIGHTAAMPEQIAEAVDAGARLSTHLGNGAHGMLRRHPNYIWEQLGDARLMASIISDGHHLPSSVMRTIIRTKTPLNTILTCDAAGLAGCSPGTYALDNGQVEILEDGRIVIAGQRQILAGSSLTTDVCVANAVRLAGVTLTEAINMASGNPARLLGFEEVRLKRGARADLFLFHHLAQDARLKIMATIAAGVVRFGTVPELAGRV